MDGRHDPGGGAFAPREAPSEGIGPLPLHRGWSLLRPAVAPVGADAGEAPPASDVGVLPATAEPLRFF